MTKTIMMALTVIAATLMHSVNAANIGSSNEHVIIERSGEFVSAAEGTALQAGDTVMALEQGLASIALDGCAISIPENSMLNITDALTCASQPTVVSTGSPAALGGIIGGPGPLVLSPVFLAAHPKIREFIKNNKDDRPTSP